MKDLLSLVGDVSEDENGRLFFSDQRDVEMDGNP